MVFLAAQPAVQPKNNGKTVSKKNYYAVYRGRKPGIYTRWFGEEGAYCQVNGYPKAVFKGFATRKEAEEFLKAKASAEAASKPEQQQAFLNNDPDPESIPGNKVVIHTDGGALNNPGPGGYGAVIEDGGHRRELSGGYRHTTNNRMEIMACIRALEALEKPSDVVLYSDSKYVVDAVAKGWAQRWRKNGWMRSPGKKAINADLWERLLELLSRHRVEFRWIRGHSGNPGNERCDALVRMESAKSNLPPDENYESGEV